MAIKNIKSFCILLSLSFVLFLFVGCSSDGQSTMPYSSSEYENSDWTLDELISHFEELGFDDIDIDESHSRYVSEEYIQVRVEDTESDSWFTEYTEFTKGEDLRSWRKIRISITYPIPVWTIENCPELVTLLSMRNSEESFDEWIAFMHEHHGEYIEFDGTITDWYDELWYAGGISFSVSFEDIEDIAFSWHGLLTSEFGYKNDYYTGCVEEGISAHVVMRIVYSEEGCLYELESIDLEN